MFDDPFNNAVTTCYCCVFEAFKDILFDNGDEMA